MILLLLPGLGRAQSKPSSLEVRKEMSVIFSDFQALQPFLIDSDTYVDPANRKKILHLIDRLDQRFHSIEFFDNRFRDRTGFSSKLISMASVLEEAKASYEEGELFRSLAGMKTVSNHCVGCHIQYKVDVKLHHPPKDFAQLPLFSQGEFYLISRNYPMAKDAYFRAANTSPNEIIRMEALLKWLMVSVRFIQEPSETLSQLNRFLDSAPLNEYDFSVAKAWIEPLEKWKAEVKTDRGALEEAQRLLKQGIPGADPYMQSVGMVELLRAASVLQEFLDDSSSKRERRRGLYLLGLTYSKLPSLLINELPEVFFEQCILEFPNTKEARLAYHFYQELVMNPYIFGHESAAPAIITNQLQELRMLAYGTTTGNPPAK